MAIRNHGLSYRPLRGGIAILNPAVNESGTIGLVATSDGTDRWIVSCYHVLCSASMGAFTAGDPIYQPAPSRAPDPIARLVAGLGDPALDCAAALVEPGTDSLPEILGIGPVGPPIEPAIGMRLMKAGLATGVTEGIVTGLQGDRVVIEAPAGFPSSHDLSDIGDSGSVWVERDTRRPVALHTSGSDFGTERAYASRIVACLERLGLTVHLPPNNDEALGEPPP